MAGVLLVLLVAPSAAAPSAAEIVVTTNSDAVNGDVTTVGGLIANPGPDGISLREGLHATNNDTGSYTIRFAPTLAGATILVGASTPALVLPPLTGGGVIIEGDIDGNGSHDVTLRPTPELMRTCCVHSGLQIASSHNRLHALMIEGFHTGVELEPAQTPQEPLPSHKTFAGNVVSALVIRGSHEAVLLQDAGCGMEKPPCPTYNRWTNTTITRNTIEPTGAGIHVTPNLSIGDRVEGLTVTENTIRQHSTDPEGGGAAIDVDVGVIATQSLISDVLIAHNEIDAVQAGGDGGIVVASGVQRAQANSIERVRILDNRIRVVRHRFGQPCCFGIIVGAGWDTFAVDLRPITYPDRNVLRNVQISGNSISGSLASGVRIWTGHSGGSRNRVEGVRVERNVIRTTANWGKGVEVRAGAHGALESPVRPTRPATANRITGVTIAANRITIGKRKSAPIAPPKEGGGIVLLGGNDYARRGVIRDVRITRNRIAGARFGIMLIGGLGSTARGNRVSCVRLAGNRIMGSRKRVRVVPNSAGASGNRASLGGC